MIKEPLQILALTLTFITFSVTSWASNQEKDNVLEDAETAEMNWTPSVSEIDLTEETLSKNSKKIQVGKIPINYSFVLQLNLKNSLAKKCVFEATTSCGCMKAGESQIAIKTGETHQLDLVVAKIAREGVFEVELKLSEQDTGKVFIITILGVVVRPIDIIPKRISILSTTNDKIPVIVKTNFGQDAIKKVGALGAEIAIEDVRMSENREKATFTLTPVELVWGKVSPVLYVETEMFGTSHEVIRLNMPDKVNVVPSVLYERNVRQSPTNPAVGTVSLVLRGIGISKHSDSIKIALQVNGSTIEIDPSVRARNNDVMTVSIPIDMQAFAAKGTILLSGNNDVGAWNQSVLLR